MKTFDRVVLKPEFDNPMVFVIESLRDEGGELVASLFPLRGGMLCAAAVDNLNLIKA